MNFWSTTTGTSKSKPKWAFRYLNKNGLVAHLGDHKPRVSKTLKKPYLM